MYVLVSMTPLIIMTCETCFVMQFLTSILGMALVEASIKQVFVHKLGTLFKVIDVGPGLPARLNLI